MLTKRLNESIEQDLRNTVKWGKEETSREAVELWIRFGRNCKLIGVNPFDMLAQIELVERTGYVCEGCNTRFETQAAYNGHGQERCKKKRGGNS